MALSNRGELPVLEGDKLLGTVSLTDIASLLHRKDAQKNPAPTRYARARCKHDDAPTRLTKSGTYASAKSDYINVILPRMGLPNNTSLQDAESHEYVRLNVPRFESWSC